MALTYLALGSNLGDRESYLRAAVVGLSERAVRPLRSASIYLSEPRDNLDQPYFLNTVIQARTALEPQELLDACLAIEKENGRVRDSYKGPRTIDIDIIFYENIIVQSPRLTIPHPHFSGRRFVLEPLAEFGENLVDPVSRKTVKKLLAETVDRGELRKVAPPLF
jgi:2-amino-4-hydroxy-6-hydroxymethyldihydropteridine diphosphokinase